MGKKNPFNSIFINVINKNYHNTHSLPQHSLILDIKTTWKSLHLMRFMEQYSAIQAAVMDPRLRKAMTKANQEHLKDEDFHKAEELVQLMKILYTSTLGPLY